jgi:hypothetical protein
MLRRILTLLALLTGLAAAGAPAHAQAYDGVSGVELTAGTDRCIQHEAREGAPIAGQARVLRPAAQPAECVPTVAVMIPAVHIGIDRSYE